MYYNLTEEQKLFFHLSYSMLEEGYSVDEIVELWCMLDQDDEATKIFESVTLTEEVDFGSSDLKQVTALYMIEKRMPNLKLNFNWLGRLFRGQKVKTPTPTTTAGGRPITSSGTRPSGSPTVTTGADASSPNAARNILNRIPPGVKDKIKKGAPIVGGAGLITVLGKSLLDTGAIPPPAEKKDEPKTEEPTTTTTPTTTADEKAKAEAEAKAKAEADAKAKAEAEAKAKAEAELPDKGWWKAERQPGLWKKSASYKAGLEAYRNVRANPVPSIYRDHYDLIADYLINEGHASTIEEAEYVMQQLDDDFIQSILEEYPKKPIGYSNPSIDGNPIPNPPGHPKEGKPMSFNKAETEGYREAMQKHRKRYPNSYKK